MAKNKENKEAKVTKKKMKKKTSKKVVENRLDQAEMRMLESLSSDISHAETRGKLQDQYAANIQLKIEKLKADIRLLEHEMTNARNKQSQEDAARKSKCEKLQKLGDDLKLKYGIKGSSFIKYDNKSGKIVE